MMSKRIHIFHMLNELFYRLCYFAMKLLDRSVPVDLRYEIS